MVLLPPFLIVFPFLGHGLGPFLHPVLGRKERAAQGEFPRQHHGNQGRSHQDDHRPDAAHHFR